MDYTLKRSARARGLRLSVRPDASVVVTASRFFGTKAIERFVADHTEWVRRHVERMKRRPVIRVQRGDIPRLKREAAVFASARCAHFAKLYGVSYGTISIRAQKSRWGSCSRKGNLNFNYRIAALPGRLADYIIVHELCHRAHMNHSKKFWNEVARAVPDHTIVRKELRSVAFVFY